jgi:hypothetical protein
LVIQALNSLNIICSTSVPTSIFQKSNLLTPNTYNVYDTIGVTNSTGYYPTGGVLTFPNGTYNIQGGLQFEHNCGDVVVTVFTNGSLFYTSIPFATGSLQPYTYSFQSVSCYSFVLYITVLSPVNGTTSFQSGCIQFSQA